MKDIPADAKLTGENLAVVSAYDVVMQIRNCSKAEAKRIIQQGGLKLLPETTITSPTHTFHQGDSIKCGRVVGKLHFNLLFDRYDTDEYTYLHIHN